eukprot:8751079-Karenia_brevis.AAC.1
MKRTASEIPSDTGYVADQGYKKGGQGQGKGNKGESAEKENRFEQDPQKLERQHNRRNVCFK